MTTSPHDLPTARDPHADEEDLAQEAEVTAQEVDLSWGDNDEEEMGDDFGRWTHPFGIVPG